MPLKRNQAWQVLRTAVVVFAFACGVGAAVFWYQHTFSNDLDGRDAASCELQRIGRETSRRNAYIDNQNNAVIAFVLDSVAAQATTQGIRDTARQGADLLRAPQRSKPILPRVRCQDKRATPVPGSAGRLMPDELASIQASKPTK